MEVGERGTMDWRTALGVGDDVETLRARGSTLGVSGGGLFVLYPPSSVLIHRGKGGIKLTTTSASIICAQAPALEATTPPLPPLADLLSYFPSPSFTSIPPGPSRARSSAMVGSTSSTFFSFLSLFSPLFSATFSTFFTSNAASEAGEVSRRSQSPTLDTPSFLFPSTSSALTIFLPAVLYPIALSIDWAMRGVREEEGLSDERATRGERVEVDLRTAMGETLAEEVLILNGVVFPTNVVEEGRSLTLVKEACRTRLVAEEDWE